MGDLLGGINTNKWTFDPRHLPVTTLSPTLHAMSHGRNSPLGSADLVCRKTTSLLNKLAASNFGSISDQIVAIMNQSARENNAHAKIISLVVDTATAQSERSGLYAQLAKVISSSMYVVRLPVVSMCNHTGNPPPPRISCKSLFRDKLLDGFQEKSEKLSNVQKTGDKRHLGLVRFTSEAFKCGLLTKAMMWRVVYLLQHEFTLHTELEALCITLKIAGVLLDTPEDSLMVEETFRRIRYLSSNSHLPIRLRFMVQDLTDLRARWWISTPITRIDDPVPTAVDQDSDEETYISVREMAMLADKINNILVQKKLKDAEHQLSCLRRRYVPVVIQMLVERVLLDSTSARFVSHLLASASSQDLFFTPDVEHGFRRALAGLHLDGEEMTPVLSILEAVGLNDERGSSILAHTIVQGGPSDLQLHPLGARELFGEISVSLPISELNLRPLGRTVSDEGLAESVPPLCSSPGPIQDEKQQRLTRISRIKELEMMLACQRHETNALRSEVERVSEEMAKIAENNEQLTQENELIKKMRNSEQMRRVEMEDRLRAKQEEARDIQKLAQENEVLKKARNAEEMRRVETEDRLRVKQEEALTLKNDLQQVHNRCQTLQAEVQRCRIDEELRRSAEISTRNAGREEGRDGMLTDLIRLLSAKRADERKAREAEKERANNAHAEKTRREAEAKRKTEQHRGAERERSRCLKRDEKYTGSRPWTAALAFERFETILLVEEFAKFKFSDSAPLTFEALPWPILTKPWTYNVNDIGADKVRAFFKSAALMNAKSTMYPIPSEHRKYLLKQSLLAFHGDKMVHRISTVGDENLRQQISNAAHIVTQTLNELMQRDG
ncbi:MIF4G domain-containing protein [Mycena capillaripes]|nr:MIF4G domain-containing protein [Mycena capillaripes]